jgi:NAD(P)H-hydrate epimerase
MVPECNFEVSRSYYPDFIVKSFPGERLDARGVEIVTATAIEQDCVIMGPGMGTAAATLEAVNALIKKIHSPMVLDTAIAQVISSQSLRDNSQIVITPHAEEFFTIFNKRLPILLIERVNMVKKLAREFNVAISLKGPTDVIAAPKNGDYCINQTGNAGLTSGGTGDVLAGLIGRLLAGGLSPYDGARLGAFIVGTAGDELALQKAHAFNATDLAHRLPYTIQELLG